MGVGVVLFEVEVALVVEHAVEHEGRVAVGALDGATVERGVVVGDEGVELEREVVEARARPIGGRTHHRVERPARAGRCGRGRGSDHAGSIAARVEERLVGGGRVFLTRPLISMKISQVGLAVVGAGTGFPPPALCWSSIGSMAKNKKTVFVAFAIEDESQRNLLKGQALNTESPFEYIDMSVKDAYDQDWKARVRTRLRRSHGVIALVSANSLTSSGQKWEIDCAKEEGIKILGIWAYTDDRTKLAGVATRVWNWSTIADFIDAL